MKEEQYKAECREIGSLGSTLPTWIRNVCRTRIDGTSPRVMEAQKNVIIRRLSQHSKQYDFCEEYLQIWHIGKNGT